MALPLYNCWGYSCVFWLFEEVWSGCGWAMCVVFVFVILFLRLGFFCFYLFCGMLSIVGGVCFYMMSLFVCGLIPFSWVRGSCCLFVHWWSNRVCRVMWGFICLCFFLRLFLLTLFECHVSFVFDVYIWKIFG